VDEPDNSADTVILIPLELRKQYATKYLLKASIWGILSFGFMCAVQLAETILSGAQYSLKSILLTSTIIALLPLIWGFFAAVKCMLTDRVIEPGKPAVPPKPKELTPEELAAKREAEAKQKELEGKWYFRYPVAVGLVGVGWFLLSHNPHDKFVMTGFGWFALLGAAIYARELSLFILALIALYFVIVALSSLSTIPVSAAILIGAVIIAMAIKK